METVYELDDHTGEVWQVQFSHDGSKMASCGKDRYVIIWKVPSFEVMHRLDAVPNFDTNHEDSGVGAVAWSPDDTILVTCGRDHHANLWDVEVSTILPPLRKGVNRIF
jgi:WD40 repeat protein